MLLLSLRGFRDNCKYWLDYISRNNETIIIQSKGKLYYLDQKESNFKDEAILKHALEDISNKETNKYMNTNDNGYEVFITYDATLELEQIKDEITLEKFSKFITKYTSNEKVEGLNVKRLLLEKIYKYTVYLLVDEKIKRNKITIIKIII